ncbi:hypothetical protein F5Y10DRAFT_269248 [Nemania abortiva]|nr:hypothetical protein F5Y10DRAFT_269248 [Nemania abortiva]
MGLTTLVNPENAVLDICLVHGFTGDPVKTWQYTGPDVRDKSGLVKESGRRWISHLFQTRHDGADESQRFSTCYWPRDVLPSTVANARIMTYGYDTHIRHAFIGQTSQNSVYDVSWDFLVALQAQRREHASRPIVFIVHSLGGIVVKEMLRRADGCDGSREFLHSIADSTRGIIFFGTPHGGADPRSFLLRIAERAVKAAGFSVNEKIVSTLLPSSERLRELRDDFGPLAIKYNWIIHSFQEQYGLAILGGKKVVEDRSSYLNLPAVEITEHIAQNHMDMCRFSGSNDAEYAKVAAAVVRMVQALEQNGTSQKQHRAANQGNPSLSEIKQSLAFEYDMARFEAIAAEHNDTCTWLLEKPEYLDWLDPANYNDHHGILWIRGKPGTGKSTLTKYALKNARQSEKFSHVIFFFFHARGTDFEKTTTGLYRSLIMQLLALFQPKDVRSILPDKIPTWTVENLQDFLRRIIGGIPARGNLVCYIDALDECEEDSVREMVSFFEDLGHAAAEKLKNFYVWFSSRHYPHISARYSCTFVLEDANGHSQDLKTYMDDKLRIGSSKPAQEVRNRLLSKASGVFLWLALVVPILNKEFDHGRLHALQQRLQDIPSDLHTLFKDMMARRSHSKLELPLCLRWILYARQPLSAWQLYHGILTSTNVEPGVISELNKTNVSNDVVNRFIIDASMGLAEIVETRDGNTVQFIHESVRDFLLKLDGLKAICSDHDGSYYGTSHSILARCCATYTDYSAKFQLGELTTGHFPIYSVENIFWHAERAQTTGNTQETFLSTLNLEAWFRLSNMVGRTAYKHGYRLLYILAAEGCSNLISATKWASSPFEVGTEAASTPWRAGLRSGSLETVKSLVEVEVNQQPTNGTFQSWNKQRVAFYESLSTRMTIYKKNSDRKYANETILFDAAKDRDVELLRFLLMTKRFNVNGRDPYGRTVLIAAARDKACIELLLSVDGINANYRDKLGQTALFMPAIGGRIDIVNLLLSVPGFRPDIRDYVGRAALSYAAGTWMEQVETVRALIGDDRVNPDSKDYVGRTPFSYAAEKGHLRIMVLLMGTGKVEGDSRDNRGWSCEQWYRRGCKDRCYFDPYDPTE